MVSLALGISTDLTYWSKGMPSLWHNHFIQVTPAARGTWQAHTALSLDRLDSEKHFLRALDVGKKVHMGHLYSSASLGCAIAINQLHTLAASTSQGLSV